MQHHHSGGADRPARRLFSEIAMDPRFEVRVASVALERRENLLRHLGYATDQLSRLSGYSVIEPLVAGCQFLKAQLTVAALTGREISIFEEHLTAEMYCIVHEILLPVLNMMRTTENVAPRADAGPEAAVTRPTS
jgi:hypothetical protein